jgi:hypothetical protein
MKNFPNNEENLLLTNCLTFLSEVCQNLVITLNISHFSPPGICQIIPDFLRTYLLYTVFSLPKKRQAYIKETLPWDFRLPDLFIYQQCSDSWTEAVLNIVRLWLRYLMKRVVNDTTESVIAATSENWKLQQKSSLIYNHLTSLLWKDLIFRLPGGNDTAKIDFSNFWKKYSICEMVLAW